MNYFLIGSCHLKNGDGCRVSLWTSGCTHKCEGCQNPETHDCNNGFLFDENAEKELFDKLSNKYVQGITFTGGDPLHENNRDTIYRLVKKIREEFPTKDIWLYTGYTWEQIQKDNSLKQVVDLIDVLVDGRFVLSLRDVNLHWCGSSNQRVIDVKATLNGSNNIVLLEGEER